MKRILLLFAGLLGLPAALAAHPHVFIKPEMRLVSGPSGSALEVVWDLDAFFSASIIAENNSRNDGTFTASEVASIRQNYFDNLKNFGYLMLVFYGGKPLTDLKVTGFEPRRHGQTVIYKFRIDLPSPPMKTPVEALCFDKSGYVAFEDMPASTPGLHLKTLKSDYFGTVQVQAQNFEVEPAAFRGAP